jgi:hypothetical protein
MGKPKDAMRSHGSHAILNFGTSAAYSTRGFDRDADAFRGAHLSAGDMARRRADGFYTLVGRKNRRRRNNGMVFSPTGRLQTAKIRLVHCRCRDAEDSQRQEPAPDLPRYERQPRIASASGAYLPSIRNLRSVCAFVY